MYPHRIRLRGPWEYEPLARSERPETQSLDGPQRPLPAGGKMTLPCRWSEGGLGDFAGRVRFRRRFGAPRQIDPHERVWLTFAGVDEVAEVRLNDQFLGQQHSQEPFEHEVTDLLRERNELVVDVEAAHTDGGVWGEVALEVRCLAFLRGVRAWATFAGESACLHVAGQVMGESQQPLEAYVVLDRYTVGYATVEAGGKSFHVVSEELAPARWHELEGKPRAHEVRIELVCGGTAWYTLEQSFTFQPA